MSVLAVHFHSKSEQWPGRQHQLDEGYFDRIDAMHYTLAHDDGQSTHDLEDADVIPGKSGKITAASPDGTTTVEVNGRHIGIGAFASQRILVTV